jgi:hypothetical protein
MPSPPVTLSVRAHFKENSLSQLPALLKSGSGEESVADALTGALVEPRLNGMLNTMLTSGAVARFANGRHVRAQIAYAFFSP